MLCKINWEHASLESVQRAINASKQLLCLAGSRPEMWIVVESSTKRMTDERLKEIVQALVWEVNGGAYCGVSPITYDELDALL